MFDTYYVLIVEESLIAMCGDTSWVAFATEFHCCEFVDIWLLRMKFLWAKLPYSHWKHSSSAIFFLLLHFFLFKFQNYSDFVENEYYAGSFYRMISKYQFQNSIPRYFNIYYLCNGNDKTIYICRLLIWYYFESDFTVLTCFFPLPIDMIVNNNWLSCILNNKNKQISKCLRRQKIAFEIYRRILIPIEILIDKETRAKAKKKEKIILLIHNNVFMKVFWQNVQIVKANKLNCCFFSILTIRSNKWTIINFKLCQLDINHYSY